MASTGKKGKKTKGKTVPLNDFLATTSPSWIDQVDEADKLGEFNWKPALPAAPRAARELDESTIPKNPPFVAYLLNLSYELEESDILNAFSDLSISSVRLPRDDRSGRLKGFGYVEFKDRTSFISALQKHEATIRGRRIKIDVAENEGERRRGGMRDNRDRDSNYDPEKTLGDWRSGPRSEFASNDDRRGPTSGRKEYGGFRDREGFDRNKGDRESSWRSSEKRFGSDRDRDRDSRGSYGSRRGYSDSDNNYSEPKTRKKLNLKPRSKPIEEIVVKEEPPPKKEERPEKEKPSAASIFGQAKPVDTAAREREIEERLAKEKGGKNEKDPDSSKHSDSETGTSEATVGKPAPKENVWARKSVRSEGQNLTSWGTGSEKTDDLNEPPPAGESDKSTLENADEPSRYSESKKYEVYENDNVDERPAAKYDNRFNERNREGERSYRRDDKERRDKKEDRRDRGYDSDRRGGGSGGRTRDQDRDGDPRRFSEKDGEHKKFSNDREPDNKRYQERESGRHRDQDDHGGVKGTRGDRRGTPSSGDKASRQVKTTQEKEKERGPQSKDKLRDQKKSEEGIRMPKLKESETPNYIGTNKYSFLEEDGVSE